MRDFPAHGERLTAEKPDGVRHVLVNGTPIRIDGVQLNQPEARPGMHPGDRVVTDGRVEPSEPERPNMSTTTTGHEVRYDPYDVEINTDPYPVYRRMREEAPLYRNDVYDFYALSRFDDVERGLVDRETYISGRGAILELIQAGIEIPSGVVIFEDPPIYTVHRGLLSRAFTPKKMNALEPRIRELCAQSLDPLMDADGFDFIRDFGATMPMRVIGMLLGIPEQDQEAIRDQADSQLRTNWGNR